jgi:hypothetical protein
MKDETMSKKKLLEKLGEPRRQVAAFAKADIERTQQEEGLGIQREKYRAVFDSITARVWYFDTEGRVRYDKLPYYDKKGEIAIMTRKGKSPAS